MSVLCAQNAVPLAQYDGLRTNANLAESALTTANVNAAEFGMLFTRTLDGYSYAHPLYVPNVAIPGVGLRNVVYAATLHNTVYAFDADNPAQTSPYWSVNLGPSIPFPPATLLGYVQPEMGIMSTPAIDLGTGTLYVVATTQQGSDAAMYLNALDLSTGAQKFGSPALIQAHVSGSLTAPDRNPDGTITWNPNTRMQRSALLVANGNVYVGFATYGAFYQYHGWVMAYSASNVQNQIAVFNTTLNGEEGGVWQSGRGLAVDSQGNIYLASGNGTYNGTTDFGNSFIKLGPNLQVLDWFTPSDWSTLFQDDLDLGSSGPVLLPNSNLLMGAGKQGVIYLLNSQNMGQLQGPSSQPLQEFQATPVCTSATQCTEVHSVAVWDASPSPRFYVWGWNDVLRGFQLTGGQFDIQPFSQSSVTSAYPGGGITVSSLGSTAGSGIVWAMTAASSSIVTVVHGTLRAFDALDLSHELWNSDQNPDRDSLGSLAKFAEPVVANGRVYVPTFSNRLDVYGLLSTAITVTSMPAGLLLTVDNFACTTPCNFQWVPGSSHTIAAAASPQPGAAGIQYVYSSWSDGGALSHPISIGSGQPATYTAAFQTQYSLTTAAAPSAGGSVTPSAGAFYGAGTSVPVVATPNASYVFVNWSAGVANTRAQSTTVLMAAPETITATFAVGPPAMPLLSSPQDGATGVATAPNLTWTAASGATSYQVYFGTSSPPPLAVNTTLLSYSPGTLSLGVTYYWFVAAMNSASTTASATRSFTTTSASQGSSGALQFYPIVPCRLVDTRAGEGKTGAFGPPGIAASTNRNFGLLSAGCSIPAIAQAYSLNFTAVPSGPLGFLSAWPTGSPYPGVSTLNSSDGSIIANAAIVPAGTGGSITVVAGNPTDLIIDVNGYFASAGTGSLDFYPRTPCRVADTRVGEGKMGAFGPPSLSAYATRDFPLLASPCLSGSARAYSLNMTAVPDGGLGFLSTWPAGGAYPGVSTLNSSNGIPLANAAIVSAGSNGDIDVVAGNATDLIIDINGTFAAPATGGLQFYAVTPCRLADTRAGQGFTGSFGPPTLAALTQRNIPIQSSRCGIPATAQAYALNMTAVPQGPLSFLSAWPAGQTYPGVSTLNSSEGNIMANAAIIPAGTSGAITILASNPTDLIIDIVGYFAP